MAFVRPTPKPKGTLKRWLERKETYWKLRKWWDNIRRYHATEDSHHI